VQGIPLLCSFPLGPVHPEADLSAANKSKYLEAGHVFNINVTQSKGHDLENPKQYREINHNKNWLTEARNFNGSNIRNVQLFIW
jgi:hypothetical protein